MFYTVVELPIQARCAKLFCTLNTVEWRSGSAVALQAKGRRFEPCLDHHATTARGGGELASPGFFEMTRGKGGL